MHTVSDPERYDELDLSQWEFYVLPRQVVADRDGRSMSLTWLQEHAGPTPYGELAGAVDEAAAR
ncbi:hypothetical protein [Isoptericola croceus]|uniref:hypothetical protein n=1 Tax=Isoptericola croceus TaxID=3031406 RepID=UPI0023F99E59|nr:hypothetical protein [Isoptericola croceus]